MVVSLSGQKLPLSYYFSSASQSNRSTRTPNVSGPSKRKLDRVEKPLDEPARKKQKENLTPFRSKGFKETSKAHSKKFEPGSRNVTSSTIHVPQNVKVHKKHRANVLKGVLLDVKPAVNVLQLCSPGSSKGKTNDLTPSNPVKEGFHCTPFPCPEFRPTTNPHPQKLTPMRPTSRSWLPEDALPTPPLTTIRSREVQEDLHAEEDLSSSLLDDAAPIISSSSLLTVGLSTPGISGSGRKGLSKFQTTSPLSSPVASKYPHKASGKPSESPSAQMLAITIAHNTPPLSPIVVPSSQADESQVFISPPTKNASSVMLEHLASFRLPEIPSLGPSRRRMGALGGAGHLAAVESRFDPVRPSPDDTTVPSSQTQELDVFMASTTDSRKVGVPSPLLSPVRARASSPFGMVVTSQSQEKELMSHHLFCGSPSSRSEIVLSSQFLDDEVYLLGGPAYSRFSPATVPAASSKHIVDLVDRDIAPVSPATVQSSQSQEKELSIASSEALPGGHWPSSQNKQDMLVEHDTSTSQIECDVETYLPERPSPPRTPNRRPLSAAGVDKLSGQIVAEEPIIEDIEDSESDIPVSTSPLHAPSSYNGTFDVQPYPMMPTQLRIFLDMFDDHLSEDDNEDGTRAGAETQADFGETFSSAALDGAPRCTRSMNGKMLVSTGSDMGGLLAGTHAKFSLLSHSQSRRGMRTEPFNYGSPFHSAGCHAITSESRSSSPSYCAFEGADEPLSIPENFSDGLSSDPTSYGSSLASSLPSAVKVFMEMFDGDNQSQGSAGASYLLSQ